MNLRIFRLLSAVVIGSATMGLATQSQAHHAFAAEFDSGRPIKVKGALTKANIVNPHSWLYLDVKNKDGSVTNWGFEFSTPNTLRANGVTRDTIKIGSEVSIEGYMAKNGGPFGYAAAVTFADGRKVRSNGAPDAPAETAANGR